MKTYTTLQIGEFHSNYCEDFFVVEAISSNEKLIAVLDGCTMGTESIFASILAGKILRKIAKELFYSELAVKQTTSPKCKLKSIVQKLFQETLFVKNHLGLETNELLTTLVIGVIDCKENNAEFLTVGDGLIYYNGNIVEYEQDNKPDYFAYHLSEDFENWFDEQSQKLTIDSFKNLSITTDGIFAFKNLRNTDNQLSENKIISYLLEDDQHSEQNNFLERKIRELADKYHHVPTDDIAIVRLISDD